MIKSCTKCKGEGKIILSIEEDIYSYKGFSIKSIQCTTCNSLGYVDTRKNTARGRDFRISHKRTKKID